MQKDHSFQHIIATLQDFWQKQDCVILQPIDNEVGAGTLHPATTLRTLTEENWNIAYVQPSRRPKDARFGRNPNRLQHYYQFQVIMKPAPDNIQELVINSIAALGIDPNEHDIRFVEDDWENPTIGAWGLGWEVWCDGMEVLQFTYMQQIGGIELDIVPAELTYGIERFAMYIQNKSDFKDIIWNNAQKEKQKSYKDIYLADEEQFSQYYLHDSDEKMLFNLFAIYQQEAENLLTKNLPLPAYNYVLKACHCFNMLDAKGVISVTDRASYIAKVRQLAKNTCLKWVENKQ